MMIVADDGLGIVPKNVKVGMGTKLVTEIARRLGATFTYQPGRPGTIGVLAGPASALKPASNRDCRSSSASVEARDQTIDAVGTART